MRLPIDRTGPGTDDASDTRVTLSEHVTIELPRDPSPAAPDVAHHFRSRRYRHARPINLLPGAVVKYEAGARWSPVRLAGQLTLIAGLALAGMAAWHLWGTGLLTAGEQSRLASEFEERLIAADDLETSRGGDAGGAKIAEGITVPVAWDDPTIEFDTASLALLESIPDLEGLVPEIPPAPGEALGRIVIEKADIDWIVAEGTSPEILKGGPGHIIGSAMPGQVGNTVISGHRTTNGAPFFHLDRLEPGDEITVESLTGVHTYRVTETRIVRPDETWVLTQWDNGSWLTLTTCNPRYSSRQRLIVFAELIGGPNAATIHERFGAPDPIPGT
jgi:LPXTG-site transpeptidase (sortase) family protein